MEDLSRFDLSRSEWETLIDQWIIGNDSERNRKMLKRRLLDGVRYEQLAEEFDLSTTRTKSIIYKAQNQLFKRI